MMKAFRVVMIVMALSLIGTPLFAADNPFVGYWALDLPGGGAGWLGVTQQVDAQGNPYLDAGLLWGGGSVVPVDSAFVIDDTLYVLRLRSVDRGQKGVTRAVRGDGTFVRENYMTAGFDEHRVQQYPDLLTCKVSGDTMSLTHDIPPTTDGKSNRHEEFNGKRIPPVPPAPDLSKVKYGDPIALFNGKNLDGWKLTDPNAVSGWHVENGILINDPKQTPGQPHIPYGNLRTEQEFEDFNIKLELNVTTGGNSGIYLRGIYEVQVEEDFGKPLDSHHLGGVYSRICPRVNAEKPAGEWQSMDITLCDRHVTVILNGVKIIDNEPLYGCTGGALTSDEFRPGPLYLQGDHTGIQYRNIVLTPIVK